MVMEMDDPPPSKNPDRLGPIDPLAALDPRKRVKSHSITGMMEDSDGAPKPHQQMTQLSLEEKKFLLAVERGDVATSRRMLQKAAETAYININCEDPLGRSALLMAIDNENLEMVELLLEYRVETKDALLHAISEEYVEAVEVLLEHEDVVHIPGEPHTWESVPSDTATFSKDITPLILAAHRDNYEIIKLLLDRGKGSLPQPHDIRCGCDECVNSRQEDSLRHSRSRINAYRALASPSLIEHEFKAEYMELRARCEDFATALIYHTRGSYELEVLLNHDPHGPQFEHGDRMHLNRLKLAIKFRQKKFVAHPNVQQLLASIWYEGLPGFRRRNMALQAIEVIRIGLMFPLFSFSYIVAPKSNWGVKLRKPFIKFICHSSSYFTFLFLLILASQRFDTILGDAPDQNNPGDDKLFGRPWLDKWVSLRGTTKRSTCPICGMVRLGPRGGLEEGQDRRETWDAWDPMLIAEAMFAGANIFSSLKLVYIFSVNPYLGPLQISLGRMVMDIIKFFFLYILVLFAFSCGMNQLLWYYAELQYNQYCINPEARNITGDKMDNCHLWRRFSNLWETSQTLFWAVFGLVELESFEFDSIKSFTRFWGMLMFGCFSVINIVVLLNLLIAMMNHSYQLIFEKADVEWKFARSKLWISYFEEGATVPPPFNIIPTPKSVYYILRWVVRKLCRYSSSAKREHIKTVRRKFIQQNERDLRYQNIMRNLVRRYVTSEQRQADNQGVTEDDVNEIKQDISAFRCELLEVLKNSGMNCSSVSGFGQGGKKNRQKERRLMKGFNITPAPNSTATLNELEASYLDKKSPKFKLAKLARITGAKREMTKKKWGTIIEAARAAGMSKIIGRSRSEDSVCSNGSEGSAPGFGERKTRGSGSSSVTAGESRTRRERFALSRSRSGLPVPPLPLVSHLPKFKSRESGRRSRGSGVPTGPASTSAELNNESLDPPPFVALQLDPPETKVVLKDQELRDIQVIHTSSDFF